MRVSIILLTKTFHLLEVLLCHNGLRRNTVICLKIATSLKKISRLFKNVNLGHHKVSIMLLTKHVISLNNLCVLLDHMGFHRNTVDCLKIATSLKANRDI